MTRAPFAVFCCCCGKLSAIDIAFAAEILADNATAIKTTAAEPAVRSLFSAVFEKISASRDRIPDHQQ
jgi:hypothetical protein